MKKLVNRLKNKKFRKKFISIAAILIILLCTSLYTVLVKRNAEKDTYGWNVIRKGQKAFRFALLSNYKFQCCLSDITTVDMLLASHIVPWSKDEKNRGL